MSNLPQLLLHVYWLEKEQFELREDEYEDWVLFLVEAGSLRYRIGKYEGIAESEISLFVRPTIGLNGRSSARLRFIFCGLLANRLLIMIISAGESACPIKFG